MTHPDALKIWFMLHWIGEYGNTAIEYHERLYHWQNCDAAFACTMLEAIKNSDPNAIPLPSEFLLTYKAPFEMSTGLCKTAAICLSYHG
jgi:hypothetical protein